MAMTTKELLEELVNHKELFCDNGLPSLVEPIYVKLDRYDDLMFKYKECSYSLHQFSNLFPQYYQYTRITASNWRVVEEDIKEEVKPKPKEWYELVESAGKDTWYIEFSRPVLCHLIRGFNDIELTLVIGYGYGYELKYDEVWFVTTDGSKLPYFKQVVPIATKEAFNYLTYIKD